MRMDTRRTWHHVSIVTHALTCQRKQTWPCELNPQNIPNATAQKTLVSIPFPS